MIRMLEPSRTERFFDGLSKHIASSLIATLLVFAVMVALIPNAERYRLFTNCLLTVESTWLYAWATSTLKRFLRNPGLNLSERKTRAIFALQFGLAFIPGIFLPFAGYKVAASDNPPTFILLNLVAFALLSAVVAAIVYILPVKKMPSLKYGLFDRIPHNRKQLDTYLKIFLLQKPELVQAVNARLRANEPYRAIQYIVSHSDATADQAKSLLPRIAAQDLKQLFPETE